MRFPLATAVVATLLAHVHAISISDINGVMIVDFGKTTPHRILLKNVPGKPGAFELKNGLLEPVSDADMHNIEKQGIQQAQRLQHQISQSQKAMDHAMEAMRKSMEFQRRQSEDLFRNMMNKPFHA